MCIDATPCTPHVLPQALERKKNYFRRKWLTLNIVFTTNMVTASSRIYAGTITCKNCVILNIVMAEHVISDIPSYVDIFKTMGNANLVRARTTMEIVLKM